MDDRTPSADTESAEVASATFHIVPAPRRSLHEEGAMPVDNHVSTNPFESAHVDSPSIQQEAPATAANETAKRPSTNPFAGSLDKNPFRAAMQDQSGVRLNADHSKLAAFKQSKADVFGSPAEHSLGDAQRLQNKWGALAGGGYSAEMKQFAIQNAHEQIDIRLLEATLESEKHLAGLVAKMSEPIR
jgi:hypothetical protein